MADLDSLRVSVLWGSVRRKRVGSIQERRLYRVFGVVKNVGLKDV
jgi:hypothetical protein